MEAKTKEEAMSFFLRNSEGSINCIKGDTSKECNCYPDAKQFFGE